MDGTKPDSGRSVPESRWSSSLVLHPSHLPDLKAFLELVRQAIPGIDASDPGWTADGERMTNATLRDGDWVWHLLIDIAQMPPQVAAIAEKYADSEVLAAIHRHRMYAIIALTGTPAQVDLVSPMRRLAMVTWPWLQLGANAVLWPDAGTAWPASELLPVQPAEIGPDELYLFVGSEILGADSRGRILIRSRGLQQFSLPDLACYLPESLAHSEQAMTAVDTFLASMPPYLLEGGQTLQHGETIEVEPCVWRVVSESSGEAPPFSSPHGILAFELVEGP